MKLRRFYANNYKTLVNFEVKFEDLTVIAGPNGSGKSNFLDALKGVLDYAVQDVALPTAFGGNISPLVGDGDDPELSVTVGLEVGVEPDVFEYRLDFGTHPSDPRRAWRLQEAVSASGSEQLTFSAGHGVRWVRPEGDVRFEVGQNSILALANTVPLAAVAKRALGAIQILRLVPSGLEERTSGSVHRLLAGGENFFQYLRHVLGSQASSRAFVEMLRYTSLPNLTDFRFVELPDQSAIPYFDFEADGSFAGSFAPQALSDGQRALIILNTLLWHMQEHPGVLLIDEPENFLSVAEIQPLLFRMLDATEEQDSQFVLITHHPEFINSVGNDAFRWFERIDGGPTQVRMLPVRGGGLPRSILVQRGWTDAE